MTNFIKIEKKFVDGQIEGLTYARTHGLTDGRTFETGFITSTLSKSRPKKAFHNRFRALGPELIPVYRQSARR